jgi:hypothetical protein
MKEMNPETLLLILLMNSVLPSQRGRIYEASPWLTSSQEVDHKRVS